MQLVKDGASVQAAPDDKALRRDLNTQAKFVNENVSHAYSVPRPLINLLGGHGHSYHPEGSGWHSGMHGSHHDYSESCWGFGDVGHVCYGWCPHYRRRTWEPLRMLSPDC